MKNTLFVITLLWSSLSYCLTQEWWNQAYPNQFDTQQLQSQHTIVVSNNQFIDENKRPFIFKGVSIADPDKLKQQGKWNKSLFSEVKNWGANTIRLPIHPGVWEMRGAEYYIALIDQAVIWANQLDLYLILDWHSIGNLQSNLYQHPMYETSWSKTQQFWKQIAFRYQNVPTIAVYELFNEPTNDYIGYGTNSLGKLDWGQWRIMMESLIDIIRSYDDHVIPLVAGFNWAYDLTPVRHMPIERDNIAYAVHPYPQKAKPTDNKKQSFFMLWQDQWGFVANNAPMIATEIGWSNDTAPGAHIPTINNDGTYGPNIIDFLSQRGISWTAWVFDPEWAPQMIKNWSFEPTEQGVFFKQVLSGKYKTEAQLKSQ